MASRNFDLTISPLYQPDWTPADACREFISNGLDAERRGVGTLSIKPPTSRDHTMVITTHGVVLDKSALLLGTSESRDRADCIGTFGEGLVMGIMTLARLSSEGEQRIIIDNGQDRWTPTVVDCDDWKAPLVRIKVRRRRVECPDDFAITITDVGPEFYEDMRDTFLSLDPEFDVEQSYRDSRGDRVLTQPEYKGRLYAKGVLVKTRHDLSYGYSLDLTLNRDRTFVDEWDLRWRLQGLMSNVVDRYPDTFASAIADLMDRSEELLEFNNGNYQLCKSDALVDAVVDKFDRKHGSEAVPCGNMAEARDLEAVGKQAIILGKAEREILELRKGTAAQAIATASTVPTDIHSWSDLTPVQRTNLDDCVALVGTSTMSEAEIMSNLQVVTFTDRKQRGSYNPSSGQIRLDLSIIDDMRQTLDTLTHEVAHAQPGAKDGSLEHSQAQIEVYKDIIMTLLT